MLRKFIVIGFCCTLLVGCADPETPRDVIDVSSKDIATIVAPKVTQSSPEKLEIRYAQITMGSDSGCNPFKSFSDKILLIFVPLASVSKTFTSTCIPCFLRESIAISAPK